VKNLEATLEGQTVLVRARVHDNVLKGNMVFLVLREDFFTIQAVAFKHKDNATISKQFIKYLGKVPKESIVEIEAKVVKPPEEIKSTTQKVELAIISAHTISRS
jgi:aspartyl/asparaginyl-tRNA synthetase